MRKKKNAGDDLPRRNMTVYVAYSSRCLPLNHGAMLQAAHDDGTEVLRGVVEGRGVRGVTRERGTIAEVLVAKTFPTPEDSKS